jgi:hypothetical protein
VSTFLCREVRAPVGALAHAVATVVPGYARLVSGLARPCPGLRLAAGSWQRPPLSGWSAIAQQVVLTYTASIVVSLAAQQAGRPELIRSRHSRPRSLLGRLMSEKIPSKILLLL